MRLSLMCLRLNWDWRIAPVSVVLVATLSYLGDRFLGLPYWAALGVAVLAMIATGVLAEWEDDQPGGFLNPTEDPVDRKAKRD
jgi:hypothetical protein